jgi:predicted small lipoprotein YifL
MVRHASARCRRIATVAMIALALAGCGTKGPLVPAKKTPEDTPRLPPPATTAPEIPAATLPTNPQPAP